MSDYILTKSDQEEELKKLIVTTTNEIKSLDSFNGELAVLTVKTFSETTVTETKERYLFNPFTRKFYKVV